MASEGDGSVSTYEFDSTGRLVSVRVAGPGRPAAAEPTGDAGGPAPDAGSGDRFVSTWVYDAEGNVVSSGS